MAERIARHRAQRPPTWRTLEVPVEIGAHVTPLRGVATVVVEDLTLLLSNLMTENIESAEARAHREMEDLVALEANVILVSNEVGMGIVPEHELGRLFRDALGRVNQAAASACGEVYLLVAGLPLRLK